MKASESKTRIIHAALDLLSQSGLSGVGINQVVASSAAPRGSIYHFFPGGKLELATVALEEEERGIGQWLRGIFDEREPIAKKVESLFAAAAANSEASGFNKSCPVAAVTLDIDHDSERLRAVCHRIFMTWRDIIAAGLDEVPEAERRGAAELILATLEGAHLLSRSEASKDPLLRAGRNLGAILARRFQAAS
jgi:TetR/AcrR family transcriptional regulator, lmrAB and yxaGH operons repressor